MWPQLTFWMRRPGGTDGEYDGGEGFISPNVLMPDCNERHANVSGEIMICPNATTVSVWSPSATSTMAEVTG